MSNQKKQKKQFVIMGCILAAVILWLVAAHYFGPDSNYGIRQEVARLQKDSIQLQQDFTPKGRYSHHLDVSSEVHKIRDLGNPLRFGSSEIDSTRLFSNQRTASLANYNIAKCDSVLAEVLPKWRRMFAFALYKQYKDDIITFGKDAEGKPDYSVLFIYSMRYASEKEIKKDAMKLNGAISNVGFKKVTYALSPENSGLVYQF